MHFQWEHQLPPRVQEAGIALQGKNIPWQATKPEGAGAAADAVAAAPAGQTIRFSTEFP